MPKFYTLKDMTQEDLNKLSLERNTFIKEIDILNKECDTYMKIATKRGNIIDELEKYISDYKNVNTIQGCEVFYKDELLNRLKELKEGNKDE